ncbi:MAG TPA: EamA family transporter [Candidatus Lokiarchaeia archaeon]|nr:EamA family transporter [Candidatus Lokiarchaeia archaeon]
MANEDLPLAIILSLITAFTNGIGFYLQKKGLSELNTQGLSFIKFLLAAAKNRKWLLGFIIIVIRIPLYVYALEIGPITVTQPLANTGIIIIVFIGMKYMHEKLGKVEIVGICLILAGICIISFTSPGSITNPPNDQIFQGLFILGILMLVTYIGCIVLLVLKKKAIALSLVAGISMGIAAILIRTLAIMLSNGALGSFLDIHLDIRIVLGILRNDLVIESIVAWGAVIFLILYFASSIPAVDSGKLTFVIPVWMGTSFILPVLAGYLIFVEPALPLPIIGICACFAGILMLSQAQASVERKIKQETLLRSE